MVDFGPKKKFENFSILMVFDQKQKYITRSVHLYYNLAAMWSLDNLFIAANQSARRISRAYLEPHITIANFNIPIFSQTLKEILLKPNIKPKTNHKR